MLHRPSLLRLVANFWDRHIIAPPFTQAAMARITEGPRNGEDVRPQTHTIYWVPLIKFGGITYVKLGKQAGPATPEGGADLRIEDLGPELYRIAFRGDGYAGPNYRH